VTGIYVEILYVFFTYRNLCWALRALGKRRTPILVLGLKHEMGESSIRRSSQSTDLWPIAPWASGSLVGFLVTPRQSQQLYLSCFELYGWDHGSPVS
jgi:hypothetical protein